MHHARATLREKGYRLTPQRNVIWEVLRDAGRHMTAEEITAAVNERLPDVNASTVYRTLALLVDLELVVETYLEGSTSYYEVSAEPSHHHFVCSCCGQVGHFSDDLLAAVHANLRDEHGFAVSQIQVTAIGLCRDCQAAVAKAEAKAAGGAAAAEAGAADCTATLDPAERDATTNLSENDRRESALPRSVSPNSAPAKTSSAGAAAPGAVPPG
jgi:Fe2+ or Zn2+ uptake regulation protein